MSDEKTEAFALDGGSKESFRERLKMLIGDRSIRAAARGWGLSFSTLNNYLNKGTEPSFTVIRNIAHKEQISLDWLAFGSSSETPHNATTNSGNRGVAEENGKLVAAWLMVLDSLEVQEAETILKIIHRKGIEWVISACNKTEIIHKDVASHVEKALLALPVAEQERLMALHEAKKGASPEECEIDDVAGITCKKWIGLDKE
ncbi:transcriptional regulator [Sodalis endosymbiont of Spalangia cameroni]|uniref:helix-turn-helix domain-containing protein n=1 Tax=Sodalis praecaptivus TaxID=1239307 RepID=UPI0031F9B80C